MGLVVRTIGIARATVKIGLANLDYNMRRAAWLDRQQAAFPTEAELNAALAAVDGIQPRDEAEAMLAMQMYATHEVAMDFLTRAKQADLVHALECQIASKRDPCFAPNANPSEGRPWLIHAGA